MRHVRHMHEAKTRRLLINRLTCFTCLTERCTINELPRRLPETAPGREWSPVISKGKHTMETLAPLFWLVTVGIVSTLFVLGILTMVALAVEDGPVELIVRD